MKVFGGLHLYEEEEKNRIYRVSREEGSPMKNVYLIACVVLSSFTGTMSASVSDADDLLKLCAEQAVIKAGDAVNSGNMLIWNQGQLDTNQASCVTAGKWLKLSGYAQVRYQYPEHATAGFDIHRARLDFSGNVADSIDYKLQPAFEGSAAKLLDAYVDYMAGDYLKFTAGQFKIPFSRENLISSRYLATINRSQIVEALVARSKDIIGNQNGRDIGIGAGGDFLMLNDTYFFEYAIAVLNGQGIDTMDLNDQKDFDGRLLIHPIRGLSLGGDYYSGRYALSNVTGSSYERTRVGAELAYVHDPVSVEAEFIRGRDGYRSGSGRALVRRQGWYVQGTYFMLQHHLQWVLKYDTYNPDIKTGDTSTIYTIGMNWYFTTMTRLQIDYEIRNVRGAPQESNLLAAQFQAGF